MALATLTLFKNLYGEPAAASDPQAQAMLDAASSAIESWCMRTFASASYVEYHTGNGTARLALRHRPVIAVSELLYDPAGHFGEASGGFASTTALSEGIDWVLDADRGTGSISSSGILFRIGGMWPLASRLPVRMAHEAGPAYGSIKVTYTAGYATIPADLQHACCQLAARMLRGFRLGGDALKTERLGDYSYGLGALEDSGSKDPAIGSIRAVLSRYKEMGW